MFLVTIVLLMLAGDLIWWRCARRSWEAASIARRFVNVWAATMAAALLALILGRAVGVRIEHAFPRSMLGVVFLWHVIGLSVALIVGTVRLPTALAIARIRRQREAVTPTPGESTAISRRAFLGRTAAGVPVVASLAGAGVAMQQLADFRIRQLDVPIRGLPSGLDGLSIAHVSDTHLGTFTTADTFRRVVTATNDLDADLVCFTGDLINFDQHDLPQAAQFVREMRGRHGVFLCEGNHDLIEGRESFESFMRAAELPLLFDQAAVVRVNGVDVELMGLPWAHAAPGRSNDQNIRSSVDAIAGRRQAGAFPILLAHHPHAFDGAIANGIPLTLAGHTHGGLIGVSQSLGFGRLMYRYWSGLYERDGRACVVSNGAGNWFPLRINAPAEIARLTLRRA